VKIAAVLDSTCLIGLERIARLDLLPALLDPILAPPAVAAEFASHLEWLTIVAPSNTGTVAALKLNVDAGEAEAIALAYERQCRIILDDRKARAVALQLGVPVTGTVGLLLKAKQGGVISSLLPLLDALDVHEFHVSRTLRAEVLRLAGE
jgi:predicted nucleic acid-binding protein